MSEADLCRFSKQPFAHLFQDWFPEASITVGTDASSTWFAKKGLPVPELRQIILVDNPASLYGFGNG